MNESHSWRVLMLVAPAKMSVRCVILVLSCCSSCAGESSSVELLHYTLLRTLDSTHYITLLIHESWQLDLSSFPLHLPRKKVQLP